MVRFQIPQGCITKNSNSYTKNFYRGKSNKRLLSIRQKKDCLTSKTTKSILTCFYIKQTRNDAKTKYNRKSFVMLIQYDTYIYIGNDKKL